MSVVNVMTPALLGKKVGMTRVYDAKGAMFAVGHGAKLVRFRHNDYDHLEELLRASDPGAPRLVAMDGVNSMTGNAPGCFERTWMK